jgi:FixJ family two-component response regulator
MGRTGPDDRHGALTLENGEDRLKGKIVFIVDDDEEMGQSLSSLLCSLGYRVEVFTAALSFLERARSGISGCVLLDVRLPLVSGLEIQRRLSEAQQTIPTIFLTAHGDIQMAVAAMKAGAIEFLPKPFREQQLVDAVAEAMAWSERAEEDDRNRNDYQASMMLLSQKEREVLDDLSSGLEVKEIATKRNLSPSTVRVHRRNIKSKIGSKNLAELLILHNRYELRL